MIQLEYKEAIKYLLSQPNLSQEDYKEILSIFVSHQGLSETDYEAIFQQLLSLPCMQDFKKCYDNSSSKEDSRISELEKQIDDLNKDIDRQRKALKKQNDEITEKDTKVNELEVELSNVKNEKEKSESSYKSRIGEAANKLKEANDEIERLRTAHANELIKKDNKIKELSKTLESYSVSFGADDPSEKRYFEVSDGVLTETMITADSQYCASRKGDLYKYTINMEGPVKKAIDNVQIYLEPFCQIEDIAEGANTILQHSVGTAKLRGTELEIIEKTKISLIKQ